MAEIFLARRRGPGGFVKPVALKRVLPELARQEEFRQMFADEARLCASLSHPALVQVFDYGEVEGTPYLAMEWIEGCDLAELLSRGGALAPAAAAFVVAEVARALEYVHSARDGQGEPLGVVHRDLAPGNVLISLAGDVKLGDFGVAKARGRVARTDAGRLKGTLAYLAPEQASGGRVDPRADVYAAGLLLFELVTGERYLLGETELELLEAAARPPARRAADLVEGLSEGFDELLARALDPEPQRRLPGAAALEQEIRRLCPDASVARQALVTRVCRSVGVEAPRRRTEMVTVEPEGWSERAGRLLRRHLWWALAAALVAIGGAAALLFLLFDPGGAGAPSEPSGQPRGAAAEAAPARADGAASLDDGGLREASVALGDGGSIREEAGAALREDAGAASRDAGDARVPRRRPPSARVTAPRAAPIEPAAWEEGVVDAGVEAAAPEIEGGPSLAERLAEVEALRRRRGLRAGDDAALDHLRGRARALVEAGDEPAAAAALGSYRERVEAVEIDRAFIDAKLRRVSRRLDALDLEGRRADELQTLSGQALRRAVDGDYAGANRLLNQLLSRL